MEQQPPGHTADGPAPPEPFATLRRRHPDLDLVVLPAVRPAPPASRADTTDPATVDRTLATTRDEIDAVLARLRPALGDDPGPPVTRVGFGSARGSVRLTCCTRCHRSDGTAVLAEVERVLAPQGWRLARPAAALEVLVGRRPGAVADLLLHATYAATTGALSVEVSSSVLPAGDRARALVGRP